MKKLLIVIGVVVVALAFGTAYAADRDWGLYNGVTVFIGNPEPTKLEAPELALENGVTIFEPVISTAKAEEYGMGSAAGGMGAEDFHIDLYNGVTVFNPSISDSN